MKRERDAGNNAERRTQALGAGGLSRAVQAPGRAHAQLTECNRRPPPAPRSLGRADRETPLRIPRGLARPWDHQAASGLFLPDGAGRIRRVPGRRAESDDSK